MSNIEFHAVAKTGDLDEGEAVQVIVGRKEIAIYNLDGAYYATEDICTHAYASLADGYVEGELIECPLHGGCFDIKTGKTLWGPKRIDNASDYFASPIYADGKIYVAGENGIIVVLKSSAKLEILAKNDIGDSVVGTPAIADGRLYVRTRSKLVCVGLK